MDIWRVISTMSQEEILERLKDAIVNLDIDAVQKAARDAIKAGIPAYKAIIEGMAKGMEIVGQKYEDGEYFLAELIMAGETMKEGMAILEPYLKAGDIKTAGKVVIGTVRGDLHDIGKNIVVMLLRAANFEVIDLGVDVSPEQFVEAVKKHNPDIVAMSALLTTTMIEMENVIESLKKNGLRDGYIRLVISRGIGDLGLDPRKCPKPSIVIITEPLLQLHKKDVREKGISTHISWVRRDPVDATSHEVKSLNYLNSILARIEANNAGADEGICLDTRGFISEGTGENIFIVKNGELYTPPSTAGALKGITRGVVIKLASNLGYKVIERDITINDLFSADEVFLTGTAAEIAPVTEVNKRIIGDGKPGPITKALMENFYKLVRSPEEGTPIE